MQQPTNAIMTSADFALTPDLLLEHDRFVRGIARSLLRDDDATDDAVQDTWLRTLQRGPRALRSITGWLSRVVSNRAVDRRRSELRRAVREHQVARAEAIESTATACERLEVQREVVAAILGLPEPYKSVVVRRYYHDLTPTEIAAATGTKAATVRTQLVRAHELLRTRLDRRFGDRKAWTVVLLPLLEAQLALPAAAPIAMAAIAIGTIGGGIWLAANHDGAPAPLPGAATSLAAMPVATPTAIPVTDVPDAAAVTAPRQAMPQEPQQPVAAATAEVLEPRAVLLDQKAHGSYEQACFSFEFAVGGEHGAKKTRNDWDVRLWGNRLDTLTLTDDRGLVVDLGARRLAALGAAPLDELTGLVRAAATAAYSAPADASPRPYGSVDAIAGHTSFLWTLDDESDVASLFEVVELAPVDRCTLDWYSTEDGRLARGSVASPKAPRTLAQVALALRDAARQVRDQLLQRFALQRPRVLMQARVGAVGGNPCRIDLARDDLRYFRRWSTERLAMDHPATINDEALAYREGGTIPKDKKFVVTRVSWFAIANGDTNGHGYLRVQLGDQQLVDQQKGEVRGTWNGRVELVPGDEEKAWMEVSNSTVAEVVFEGEFQDLVR